MAQKGRGGFPDEFLGEEEDEGAPAANPLSVPEDVREVFDTFATLHEREAQLEQQLKHVQQEKLLCEEKLIEAMDDALISRVTIRGVTFFRRTDKYPKVVDQEEMFGWLNTIGRGDMIKPTVNAQSLRSLVLEQMRDGSEVPPCINIFEKHRVQARRAK